MKFFKTNYALFAVWFLSQPGQGKINDVKQLMTRHEELFDNPRAFRIEIEQQLSTINQTDDPELWTRFHAVAAEGAWFQEDLEGIKFHIGEALEFSIAKKFDWSTAILTYLKGGVLEYEGRFEDAEPEFLKAIEFAKSSNDQTLLAYLLGVTATFYHRSSHNVEATKHYKSSFQIFRNLPRNYLYYDFIAGLGTLYAQTIGPKKDEGFKMLESALDYAKKHKLRYLEYWSIQSLTSLIKEMSRLDNLDELFENSLRIAESLNYENYIAETRINRGEMRMREKRFQDARIDFEFAREYFRKNSVSFYEIMIIANLGQCYLELGYLDKVEVLIAEFNDSLKDSSTTIQKQFVNEMLIAYYQKTGDKESELKLLRELVYLMGKNYENSKIQQLGHLTRDMEVQRQQTENDQLSFENRIQSEQIQKQERIQNLMFLGLGLGCLVILASLLALQRGQQIKKQRANLKLILDNIDEGILKFDSKLQIQDGYSHFARELLNDGEEIIGRDLWSIFFDKTIYAKGEHQIWRDTLRTILGEEYLSWEMNESHLPRKLEYKSRSLALDWQPLTNTHNSVVDFILLRFRDITQSVVMEQKALIAEEKVTQLSKRLNSIVKSGPSHVSKFLVDAENVLQPLKELTGIGGKILQFRRDFHTLKGSARSLGLKDISENVHQIEDLLLTNGMNQDLYLTEIRNLEGILASYRDLVPQLNLLPKDSDFKNLWEIVARLFPDAEQRLTHINGEIPLLRVEDHFNSWDKIDGTLIFQILLHSLTNSIDHGFMNANNLSKTFKQISISIEADWFEDRLEIRVRDTGVGIDWNKIESMAKEKNILVEDKKQLSDLLFMDGISTANSISQTSGRGVGLAAIKSLVVEQKGELRLYDNEQAQGTVLRVRIPIGF